MEDTEWEWVQCDKCQKWRGLRPDDFDSVVQKETWYCYQNPDVSQASCDVPQILTDSEIDAIYRKRELAKSRKLIHPVIWQEIHGNAYTYKRRKSWKEDDIAICQCQPKTEEGCLENCINRMLNIECTPGYCPCGIKCSNQRFTRRNQVPVEIRKAGSKGFGLFTKSEIPEGEFVTEYMGEVVDENEYLRRRTFYAESGHKHYYFMQIGNGEVIDACRMGNVGRFMNHSCDPNCETQKWVVKGDLRVGFFASRNIKSGEELTFNYNFQTEKPIRCCCGSAKCNGTLGGQKSSSEVSSLEESATDGGRETPEVPDPIMLREEDIDEAMRLVLARQVGLNEEFPCSSDQIRMRLRELYAKHGLEQLADSLDDVSVTDSVSKSLAARESSSGESSGRPSTSRETVSRGSHRRGRSRSKAAAVRCAVDRRNGRAATWARPKIDSDRRRSEVDSSLDDITVASGKLYNPSRKNVLKVLRLFNLIEIGMTEKERTEAVVAREKDQNVAEDCERAGQIYLGTTSRVQTRQEPVYVAGYCVNDFSVDDGPLTARQRSRCADLSLLLDVVQHTIDPVARNIFIDCGILSQLQQVIGRNFGPQYSVMLRKILRIVDCLPLRKSDFDKTRSAHGTMGDLMTALTYHKDNGVRNIALSIARQYGLESEAKPKRLSNECQLSAETPQKLPLNEPQYNRADAVDVCRENQETCYGRESRGCGSSFMRSPCSQASTTFPYGGQDFLHHPGMYPPPPPPPLPAPHDKQQSSSDLSRSAPADVAGGMSLPPGFGCWKSPTTIREREFDGSARRPRRTGFHDAYRTRDPSTASGSRVGPDPSRRDSSIEADAPLLKRKKEIQERIIRRLQKMDATAEGLFSKELGKMQHVSEVCQEELVAKEERDIDEERQKSRRINETTGNELDGWDHLNREFEEFVRQTLRLRIQKYQQPEHPLRLTAAEGEALFDKLLAVIIESEENAFRLFSRYRLRRHVSKAKLVLNIKEFTSKSMHSYYDSARCHIKAETFPST